jgi:hypothetical protein
VLSVPAPFLAFERLNQKQRIVVVLNFSDRPAALPVSDVPPSLQPLGGHGFDAALDENSLTIPAWGAFFGALPVTSHMQNDDSRSDEQARNNFSIKRA